MAMIEIDGASIDASDPCAVLAALQAAELKIVTGGGVIMTQFAESQEVRWGRADVAQLGTLIQRYERLCESKSGRRSRYAKRMRFA